MRTVLPRFYALILAVGLCLSLAAPGQSSAGAAGPLPQGDPLPALAGTPIFRYPVVPGATISGYFDHQPADNLVTFYDGRHSSPGAGFYFQCTNPNMYDWVGCQDAVAGEAACSNSRELWYDEHHGTDFEYSANWHTGAYCDPARFYGITMPVYAPARGQVLMAGTDPNRPANGWHIRLKHDLNGNGNFDDDNFRSVYLHFTANALAVTAGQIVNEGQYLGLGGSTGYSSSPHLHFEVQRSADYFQTTYWPVDPYGWQGAGADPWPYANVNLFRIDTIPQNEHTYLPLALRYEPPCQTCGEQVQNGGFESGHSAWVEQGVQIINPAGAPNLTVPPYSGQWLAWLAGRDSAVDVLYQNIQVPAGAGTADFSYALYMHTTDGPGVYDWMAVNLRDTNGNLLKQLDYADNTFSPADRWVIRQTALTDLSPWQGQTLRISFEATTDASYQTSFYIDNVSWMGRGP